MKKYVALAVAGGFLASYAGTAAADGPNFTFGAAASYVFDLNDPDPLVDDASANRALYANAEGDESFNIDLVQLGVNGERGPVSYGALINMGDLAVSAGDSDDGDIGLQEAWMAINAGPATVTAGRFATHIGYESLQPWANPLISRSNAWNMQPINHDGVKLGADLGPISLMGGIVNQAFVQDNWAGGSATNNNNSNGMEDDEYGIIAAAGVGTQWADISVNALYSENEGGITNLSGTDRLILNGIVSGVCGNCRWALESTYVDTDDSSALEETTFWDVTGYAGLNWDACWSSDLRLSWSDIENTIAGFTADNQIFSATVGTGYNFAEGVQLRGEYRFDTSDMPIYGDDGAGADPSDNISVLQLQMIWTPSAG